MQSEGLQSLAGRISHVSKMYIYLGKYGVRTSDLGNYRSQTKMSNTKVVYINFPYILTPVPTLYNYSSPRYDQKHVFDLSVTYDLDLWTKILKIILHNEDSISNMYVKLQNNQIKTVVCRARSGLRRETQTHRQREHYKSLCETKNVTIVQNSVSKYGLNSPKIQAQRPRDNTKVGLDFRFMSRRRWDLVYCVGS